MLEVVSLEVLEVVSPEVLEVVSLEVLGEMTRRSGRLAGSSES